MFFIVNGVPAGRLLFFSRYCAAEPDYIPKIGLCRKAGISSMLPGESGARGDARKTKGGFCVCTLCRTGKAEQTKNSTFKNKRGGVLLKRLAYFLRNMDQDTHTYPEMYDAELFVVDPERLRRINALTRYIIMKISDSKSREHTNWRRISRRLRSISRLKS